MKYTFFFLLFLLLFSYNAWSQANLQFDQVISIDSTVSSAVNHTVYTVPAGKVLKIEFFSIYASSTGVSLMGLKVNNVAIFSRNGGTAATGRPGNTHLGVVWLKAGDQVQFFSNGGGYTVSGFLSAIQFNVAQ